MIVKTGCGTDGSICGTSWYPGCVTAGHLVVVLHKLDDHSDVVAVILDGDDPHDVGSILHR